MTVTSIAPISTTFLTMLLCAASVRLGRGVGCALAADSYRNAATVPFLLAPRFVAGSRFLQPRP